MWEEGGWQGKEGGGTEGRSGWGLARWRQQPRPSRLPVRSLARRSRSSPAGSGLPAAPAPGPAPGAAWPGGQDRNWPAEPRAGREAGRWLGGDGEDASRGSAGGTRGRGWGVLDPGEGAVHPRLILPLAPWIPGAQPGSGLRKLSSVREEVSVDRMPGVRAGCGRPGAGRRALVRSRDAAPAAGEDPSAAAARVSRGGRLPASKFKFPPPSGPGRADVRAQNLRGAVRSHGG